VHASVTTAPAVGAGRVRARQRQRPDTALAAAVLGFFVVTLDAVVVNVALPSVHTDLGGGIGDLQWVVDAYTLAFAALLLSAGSLSDRIGARRAYGIGVAVFILASTLCGAAPGLAALIGARLVQGCAAAVIMPSSMALIRQAYPDRVARGRAVAVWAMGGAVASSSGPVLGGALTLVDWRWIFLINLPVGAAALALTARVPRSLRRPVRLDWAGQVTTVLAMAGLIYAVVASGSVGIGAVRVLAALAVAVAALVGFVAVERRVAHPMVPLELFRSRTVSVTLATGFAFMVAYYGAPFVFSLYFQQYRGLSAVGTGIAFLPMMLIGLALTPSSARMAERVGRRRLIVAGLAVMSVGLAVLGLLPGSAPLWLLSGMLVLVGLGGPLVAPTATAVLLDAVPHHRAGVASGTFNTARQVGGALAIAVFGALLATPGNFLHGVHVSLLLAAAVAGITAGLHRRLTPAVTASRRSAPPCEEPSCTPRATSGSRTAATRRSSSPPTR
jgi:DHA2 family methylenomycin A resistance protein-like MFS transporter